MNESDKKRFSFIMAGMADNFRDSITKEGMRMRFEMLKEYDIDLIESAAKAIMVRRKYTKMPPIAEFLEELQPKQSDVGDRAQVAATKIIDHLKRYGSSTAPDLSDDPIAEKLMQTRWPYRQWASTILESDVKWWVKEFCDAYRAHSSIDRFDAINGPERFNQIAHGFTKDLG